MFGSEVLEVAIGLVFLYMLLCFVCSAIQEVIASVFKLRSRNLKRALMGLLGKTYTAKVLNHGMLRGMLPKLDVVQNVSEIENLIESGKKGATRLFPSYIPGRTFASIMVDILANPQDSSEEERLLGPAAAARADAESLSNAVTLSNEAVSDALREGLERIKEPQLQQAFRAVLAGTNADLGKACVAIQNWYDDSMERASGWYKRRVQVYLFLIGFVVVFVINADSISIARALAVDDDLRRTVADNATKYVQEASEDCDAVNTENPEDVNQAFDHVENAFDRLSASGLPLGWTWERVGWANRNPMDPMTFADLRTAGWSIFRKVPGLLITVFAIMLGAPFWFDLLNKLSNLRGSGNPPKTHREEERRNAALTLKAQGTTSTTGQPSR